MNNQKNIILFLLGIVLLFSIFSFTYLITNKKNQPNKKQIESIIREYLLENPEILIEMSEKLKLKQALNSPELLNENKTSLVNDKQAPVFGNANGKIKFIEFIDYRCGFCKKMYYELAELTKENNNIKVIIKELPIFGGQSILAAKYSLAAYHIDPKRYPTFHKTLIQLKNYSKESMTKAAVKSGYNKVKLEATLKNKDANFQRIIDENLALAKKLNIQGTPYSILTNSNQESMIPISGYKKKPQLIQYIQLLSDGKK